MTSRPDRCPVCQEADLEPFTRFNDLDLFRCNGCGLVFQYPPPDAGALGALYDDTYKGATESYFTKVPQKLRRARGRLRQIAAALRSPVAGKTFLDIGCNGGFVVEAAREAGFKAHGVEPDGAAIAFARKTYPANTYFHGFLEHADFGGRRFDVIYCSEVIEHAADPSAFVARISSLLADNGLLYLTTPDISHWRRPRDLARWDAFCPPSHCLYFSPNNLALLLRRHGIDVLSRRFALKPGIKVFARKRAAA